MAFVSSYGKCWVFVTLQLGIWCEIGHERGKILIFHVILLNNDISITVADIILKLCMVVVHILPEGILSQIS